MYTITNDTLNDVTLGGGVTIPPQSSKTVDFYNDTFDAAIASGLVSVSYSATGGDLELGLIVGTSMTDNSSGTADDTVAIIADAPTADAVATLVGKVNELLIENVKIKALLEDIKS